MSIKVMSKVWELSEQKGSKLLLLLAIADHAADDGYCWPGTKLLAKKIRMSVRSVLRAIKVLEADGELHVIRGNVNNRYVVLAGLTGDDLRDVLIAHKVEPPTPTGDKLSPVKMSPGDTGGAIGDTHVTSEVTQPCHPNHHEPSTNNHQEESATADALPTNFQGWHTYIKEAPNDSQRIHRLWQMCKALYPGLDPPEHSYIGRVAKRLHAGRMADLLWRCAPHPPTGSLLDYIQGVAKNGQRRPSSRSAGPPPLSEQSKAIAAALEHGAPGREGVPALSGATRTGDP